jgi:hypothetical protein
MVHRSVVYHEALKVAPKREELARIARPPPQYSRRAKPGVNGAPSPFVIWVTAKAEKARRIGATRRGG